MWNKGLYDEVTKPVLDYTQPVEDLNANDSTWVFDRVTGQLVSYDDEPNSVKGKDDYFVPLTEYSYINSDTLVFAIEGSSLKRHLPDIRGSSEIPFMFQIVDYDINFTGKILRDKYYVTLVWADDPNRCTLPEDCPDPVIIEEEGAYKLIAGLTAASLAFLSLVSF